MDNKQYAEEAMMTDTKDYSSVRARLESKRAIMLLHALMGITTECGELMDQLKKHLIYGKPLDVVNIMEEDGDLRWYLALMETACDYTADFAQERNIQKLKIRFPNHFNEQSALLRDLNKERMILEAKDITTLDEICDDIASKDEGA